MTSLARRRAVAPGAVATERPAIRAALWLGLLAPFFFLSYGFASWLAAQQQEVGSVVFAWEQRIPFLAWTIIPYWSIDLFYGLALFLCRSRLEVDSVAKRLLTAQVIAVACFILFPLQLAVERPAMSGLTASLFAWLESFDKSYNLAPSLHIALLVILWQLYAERVPRRWAWALHGWFALIGISVLTTYQHHFIDVPTGALLGWLCVWLWPGHGRSALAGFRLARSRRARRLAAAYALGAIAAAGAALALGGWLLWLLWVSVALALVAAAYGGLGPSVFQKGADGRMTAAARWLLAPYLAAARLNARLWTRGEPAAVPVCEGVWLGHFPTASDIAAEGFAIVVDLSAELPAPATTVDWTAFPSLDLVAPAPGRLRDAARVIEEARASGPVLVCCALGYSRSAAAVACWLLMTRRARSVTEASARLGAVRPRIVLTERFHAAVSEAAGPFGSTDQP